MKSEPMRADWVDAIFCRLELAYGTRFDAQWGAIPAASVKVAWAAELAGITSGGIAYALAHLPPDYPVNAMQFRALCLGMPSTSRPLKALEGPAPTQASVQRLQRAVAPLKAPKDPKAWAYALQAREAAGERLSRCQRDMMRTALSSSVRNSEPSIHAGSSPVAPDSLSTPLP